MTTFLIGATLLAAATLGFLLWPNHRSTRRTTLTLTIGVPIMAALLYLGLGNPAGLVPHGQGEQFSADQVTKMLEELKAKLDKEPDNHRGWAMLARSYKVSNRLPEAVLAYEKTGPMLETSADMLVDYADTLATTSGGFNEKVLQLIDRALKIDPAQPQALWLRGTAAFETKRFDKAIADWEALAKLLPAGSEEANIIAANLKEARNQHGNGKKH